MLSEDKQLSDGRCNEDITDSTSVGCEGCLPVYGLGFWTSAEGGCRILVKYGGGCWYGIVYVEGKEQG